MPGKRTRSSSGGSAKRAPAAQAPATPKPESKPTSTTAKKPAVVAFLTPLTGLRVLLPEGTVQFVDGRYETASAEIAAGLERAAASDPNLAIKKEK